MKRLVSSLVALGAAAALSACGNPAPAGLHTYKVVPAVGSKVTISPTNQPVIIREASKDCLASSSVDEVIAFNGTSTNIGPGKRPAVVVEVRNRPDTDEGHVVYRFAYKGKQFLITDRDAAVVRTVNAPYAVPVTKDPVPKGAPKVDPADPTGKTYDIYRNYTTDAYRESGDYTRNAKMGVAAVIAASMALAFFLSRKKGI